MWYEILPTSVAAGDEPNQSARERAALPVQLAVQRVVRTNNDG